MKKKLFPVIHCKNSNQTLENVEKAIRAGTDGVFLINHKIPYQILNLITEEVINQFPDFPIGVNYLDLEPYVALSIMPAGVCSLWTDNPQLIEDEDNGQEYASTFIKLRDTLRPHLCYYGSVAFKYQPRVKNLDVITRIAKQYMDVITTSGPATGEPPSIDKMKQMKESAGNKSLALASGVDISNVNNYLPYVDDFLVATGISDNFSTLNEEKTKELSDLIHAY